MLLRAIEGSVASPRTWASIALTRVSETPSWSLAARLEISPRARRSMTGIHSSGSGSAVRVMRWPVGAEVALGHVAHPGVGDAEDLAGLALGQLAAVDLGQHGELVVVGLGGLAPRRLLRWRSTLGADVGGAVGGGPVAGVGHERAHRRWRAPASARFSITASAIGTKCGWSLVVAVTSAATTIWPAVAAAWAL